MKSLLAQYIEEIDCGRELLEIPGVAFATYYIHRGQEIYIEDMFVAKEHRRDGVATNLGKQIEEVARKNDCKYLTHGIVKAHKCKEAITEAAKAFGFKYAGSSETEDYYIKEVLP